MRFLTDTQPFPDAILFTDESDAPTPIPVWTIDELDRFADLDSIRSAWLHTDGPEH